MGGGEFPAEEDIEEVDRKSIGRSFASESSRTMFPKARVCFRMASIEALYFSYA